MLDRSWEVQPVTWSQLTWWDPVPCGQHLLLQIHRDDLSIFPSPALSMFNNPPTPHRKRSQLFFFPACNWGGGVTNKHKKGEIVMPGGNRYDRGKYQLVS